MAKSAITLPSTNLCLSRPLWSIRLSIEGLAGMDDFALSGGSDSDPDQDLDRRRSPGQLDSARTSAKVLNSIAWPLLLWGLFAPRSHQVVIAALAVLPMSAIVLAVRSKGLYELSTMRGAPCPVLSPAFLCGLVLFIRAIRDINILPLHWITALLAAIFVGCILMMIVVRADPSTRQGAWGLILLVASLYAYGFITEADVLLDWSAPQTIGVAVLGKRYSSVNGKGNITYYLRVPEWGPFVQPNDVPVSHTLYSSASLGQTVCINLFPGALRIPWYSVVNCESNVYREP